MATMKNCWTFSIECYTWNEAKRTEKKEKRNNHKYKSAHPWIPLRLSIIHTRRDSILLKLFRFCDIAVDVMWCDAILSTTIISVYTIQIHYKIWTNLISGFCIWNKWRFYLTYIVFCFICMFWSDQIGIAVFFFHY